MAKKCLKASSKKPILVNLKTKLLFCEVCKEPQKNIQAWNKCQRFHFEESLTIDSESIYKCLICEKSFYSAKNLRRHYDSIHISQSQKVKLQNSHQTTCNKCGRPCFNSSSLKRHELTHKNTTTKEKLQCTVMSCTKTFSRNENLRRHIETQHNPRKRSNISHMDLNEKLKNFSKECEEAKNKQVEFFDADNDSNSAKTFIKNKAGRTLLLCDELKKLKLSGFKEFIKNKKSKFVKFANGLLQRNVPKNILAIKSPLEKRHFSALLLYDQKIVFKISDDWNNENGKKPLIVQRILSLNNQGFFPDSRNELYEIFCDIFNELKIASVKDLKSTYTKNFILPYFIMHFLKKFLKIDIFTASSIFQHYDHKISDEFEDEYLEDKRKTIEQERINKIKLQIKALRERKCVIRFETLNLEDYSCEICHKIFFHEKKLDSHIAKVHMDKNILPDGLQNSDDSADSDELEIPDLN